MKTGASGAYLRGADLRGADLRGADLSGAYLRGAMFDDRIFCLDRIGSVKRRTTYNATKDIVWCGCFEGTFEEWVAKIRTTYPDENDVYRKEYEAAIAYFKAVAEANKGGEEMSVEHHNARWLRLSASVRRERPICQDPFGWHKLSGHFEPATCVHHVKSVDKRPDLMFDRGNLLALCQTCHDALHGQGEALTVVLRAGVAPSRAATVVASGGGIGGA